MWPIVSQFQGWAVPRQVSIPSAIASEGDLVAALELQHGASLVRRRDLERQLLDDLADATDLLGVALGQPPGAEIDAVLEPDPDIAAHRRADGGKVDLVAPGRQDRPLVVSPEQAVRGPPHMHQIFRMRADAAQDAEDRLHEERRLQELAVEEMGQRVEMADIVAFAFEARAAAVPELADEALDLREGVADDQVLSLFDVWLLPLVLPLVDLLGDVEDAEIHRAHVERAQLRLGAQRRGQPVLHGHAE